MKLCGNDLPWESSGKHIGNKIVTDRNIMKQDVKEKRARYISKNNEICQEFYFAHPKTKFQINQIWNSHFSGSVLWDLFSHEAIQVENTYNNSVRIMASLPRETHKFYVEPITGTPHLKKVLCKRFLSFIESVKTSKKIALRNIFKLVKNDCRSVTGRNLLNIMILVNKTSIESLVPGDALDIKYHEIEEQQAWKIGVVKELTDVKFGEAFVEGFSRKELDAILNHVCVS